ncbi:metallophosphatase family protein [bacterium]|nr:metallophosphatase family protein [bacterium]MBU1993819.1 metallophosphatase family protein [bacterium]
MKIAIISDTHTKVKKAKEAIEMLLSKGVECIIHAGDIVEIEILELLKNSGLRYIAVYGNNDAHLAEYHGTYNLVQEPHYFKLSDTKFKLMHLPYYMIPDTEIVIYGHTHEFSCEFISGTLFLNSGEVCARNKSISECVMLEVNKNDFLITYYAKEKNADGFKEKQFNYKRVKNG